MAIYYPNQTPHLNYNNQTLRQKPQQNLFHKIHPSPNSQLRPVFDCNNNKTPLIIPRSMQLRSKLSIINPSPPGAYISLQTNYTKALGSPVQTNIFSERVLEEKHMSTNRLIQSSALLEAMEEHSLVAKVGRMAHPIRKCRCCDGEIFQNLLPVNCKGGDFVHIGALFPLYFEFIIYFSGLLFLCSLFCIINICLNLLGSHCSEPVSFPCISSITNSLGPEDIDYLNIQSTVNHIFIIAGIVYLEFASSILSQRRRDLEIPTERQYSALYKGSPEMTSLELFEVCRKIEGRIKDITGKENSVIKLGMVMRIYEAESEERRGAINSETEINEVIQSQIIRESWNGLETLNHRKIEADFSGKIILVFQYPLKPLALKDSKVEEISDASDIIWENIGLKGEKSKKIMMLIAVGFLMGITFLVILFIKKWIKRISVDQHDVFVIFLNLCIATIVAIFNSIEGIVIRSFARKELYAYHSKFFRIVARRLSYVFFINMVMTTFFANFLFFFEDGRSSSNELIPLDYPGLVNDFFFLFLTNSYMSSIFNYFDIFYGVKLLKRRNILKNPAKNPYSIQETKFIFEGHPVDMGLRYGNVMKTLFFTGSICPFVPSGPIFSLLGMFICYWVDKYLLLRRYTSRHQLSGDFADEMTEFGKFFIVMFAFSNLILQLIPLNDKGEPNASQFSWIDLYLASALCFISIIYKFYFVKIKSFFGRIKSQNVNDFFRRYSEASEEFRSNFSDKLSMMSMSELGRRSVVEEPMYRREIPDPKLMETIKESIIINHFDQDTI